MSKLPSPSPAKKPFNVKTARPKALVLETHVQLEAVSEILDEVARNYVARLRREVAELSRSITSHQEMGLKTEQVADLRESLNLLLQLQLDSQKGRRKDLKRIDELIGKLQSFIEKW